MAVMPERWRTNVRRSLPVRVEPGVKRPGFRRWYSRARRLGWPRWRAFTGALTFGRD